MQLLIYKMADNGEDRDIVQLLQSYIGSNATVGNDVTRMMLEPSSGGERLYAIATPFIFVIGKSPLLAYYFYCQQLALHRRYNNRPSVDIVPNKAVPISLHFRHEIT